MRDLDIKTAIREATACYRSGDYARAERIYREVIVAAPLPLHYADLGIILEAQGRFDDAIAAFRQAIEMGPREARPHYNLGNVLKDRGRTGEAADCYRRAIRLAPRYADALNALGMLLLDTGQHGEARAPLEAAIAADPRHHYAHNNLGNALQRQGALAAALRCYERALKLKPDYAEAWSNLGAAQMELDRLDDALANCRKAVRLRPDFASGHFNLANVHAAALHLDEAIASYERALVLEPGNAGFHWNYATALLLQGDYARGWREYEWRWQGCPELKGGKPGYSVPEWRGEDVSGKAVLLHAEQGRGDVIQFIRYAAMVAGRGATAFVVCHPELSRLLAGVAGVTRAIAVDAGLPAPHFDFHCPLLSLPLVFATTVSTIPAGAPYIRADPALAAGWRERIGTETPAVLKVGLIWGGWAANRIDRARSIPLAALAPLAGIAGVQFYSLQKGEQAAQALSPPAGMRLVDWSGELDDFADTAALVENLDLVISVDTAGAHLAAAMGKPVWLMNRYRTDWRWLLEREDSPWYPTLRIFRQAKPGAWEAVVEKAAHALAQAAAKKASEPKSISV